MEHRWTVADLAELTERACSLECAMADQGIAIYCENCQVVAVRLGDKYCLGCAGEIADYLAVRFDEQWHVDGGLY
jgi:hypothetical protein